MAGSLLILVAVISSFIFCGSSQAYKGRWSLLRENVGISAMHIQLLPNNHVVMFDRTDAGPSNITLAQGKCRKDPNDEILKSDCFAHSVEFDPDSLNVRPLTVQTDTWCSSGALSPDGILLQSGGFNDGEKAVRSFVACDGCDWTEDLTGLLEHRWYASNQNLPDGRIIVVGGRDAFNYEFVPKISKSDRKLYDLQFLRDTKEPVLYMENNLYPFLHLCPDGNLFIFANNQSILLDYTKNQVIREYPVIPGGVSRNYPSTGSSALLPLKLNGQTEPVTEVLICGGTAPDAYLKGFVGKFLPTSTSCGRMVVNAPNPVWVMEEMPLNRAMGDMIMLPTGDVLIINGAAKGTAGWDFGREPVLNPVLYMPEAPAGSSRFEVLNPSGIPRMYHSVAQLLTDGRVLVGGSNPHHFYNFSTPLFPTDLSIEAFYPPYMSSGRQRPEVIKVEPAGQLTYNQHITVTFRLKVTVNLKKVSVTMVSPSFTTHSLAMHQRLLVLDAEPVGKVSTGKFALGVYTPATASLAPPGYYMLFVVHAGFPSKGQWVKIS